ncbi:MAG TPA: FAD-binding oxidoreductase [Caulobacteraceae bacterium]|jgi:glycine/D-amino acid oxidase-like deaminating enzyme
MPATSDAHSAKRDLRTGRPLWADSAGLNLPVKPLRAPADVDVAIVGAGISGAFMARELSRDLSVVVVDRRGPVLGSTLASTALLQWELDLPLRALAEKVGEARAGRVYLRARAAVETLTRIVRAERITCGLTTKSSLYLAGDAYGARALKQETARREALGLPSVFLDGAQVREQFGIDRTGAIVSSGAASADPARLAAALLRRATACGARIFAPVEVTGVLQGKGHVTLVNDAGIEVRARHVVFCCGYEFPDCVPTHGARILSTWALASQPIEHPPPWLRRTLVWEASDPYLYFRLTQDGRLVVGGEDEASPTRHADPKTLTPKAKTIVRKLETLLPELKLEIDYAWAGAFGESASSMPLMGPIPGMPRGYAVMGFGGNGITFSVIASQIVSAAIRGRPDPEARDYAFDRET